MQNVLIAGLLGGLLGGGVAVTAGRLAPVRAPAASIPNAEAKAIPDGLMAKLKANDVEGFATAARGNMYSIPDPEFIAFKTALSKFREQTAQAFGKPLGEVELLREQSAGPDVARVIYLEKFEKGGVAWYFQLYRGSEGWKLASVNWDHTLNFAFAGAQ